MAHVKVVLWSLCGLGIPTRKDPDPAGGSFFSADVDAKERRGAWVGDREEGRFRTNTPLSFRPRTCGMERDEDKAFPSHRWEGEGRGVAHSVHAESWNRLGPQGCSGVGPIDSPSWFRKLRKSRA